MGRWERQTYLERFGKDFSNSVALAMNSCTVFFSGTMSDTYRTQLTYCMHTNAATYCV